MRDPDFVGAVEWRAWKSRFVSQDPQHAAALGSYLLFCPGAHAYWSYWGLSVVHLRDIPGVGGAARMSPEMTHEMLIMAIDPERCPEPDPDVLPWPFLRPLDLVEQFQVPGDEYARQLAGLVVERIMTGQASPDQDFRSFWRIMIQGTAKHYRDGKHPLH